MTIDIPDEVIKRILDCKAHGKELSALEETHVTPKWDAFDDDAGELVYDMAKLIEEQL